MSSHTANYRPDIDGLRAIAVLSVILYHIDERLLPGGYVGVDIFFVISGFLITRMIATEVDSGSFSLIDFYRRRIKRIAPAALTVIGVTLLVGAAIMTPEDARDVGQSVYWALLSIPNVFFYLNLDQSYFADDSREIPLLHLWSLGVEEQFYLLWPIALMVAMGRLSRRALVRLMAATAVLSFLGGQVLLGHDAAFAYYMLPSRAGELLVGGLVAFGVGRFPIRRSASFSASAVAFAGLTLIGLSLIQFDSDTPFPGVNAVWPTVGTGMVIAAGSLSTNRVTKGLGVRPMVWIGLISYSAYLWHWPILAFTRYAFAEVAPLHGAVILVSTIVVATLSWRYIERPFRNTQSGFARTAVRQLVVPAVVLSVMAASVQILWRPGSILTEAYARELERIDVFMAPASRYRYDCHMEQFDPGLLSESRCVVGWEQTAPRVLLWGDSNAAHYMGIIAALAEAEGFSLRNATHSACPPLLEGAEPFVGPRYRESCLAYLKFMASVIADYDVHIIAGSWTSYPRDQGSIVDAVSRTVDILTRIGKTVIVMGKAPIFTNYSRSCELRKIKLPFLDCEGRSDTESREFILNLRLQEMIKGRRTVHYFDPRPFICQGDRCSPYRDGRPIYYDAGHLSMEGSWAIGREMIRNGQVPPSLRAIAAALTEP